MYIIHLRDVGAHSDICHHFVRIVRNEVIQSQLNAAILYYRS